MEHQELRPIGFYPRAQPKLTRPGQPNLISGQTEVFATRQESDDGFPIRG